MKIDRKLIVLLMLIPMTIYAQKSAVTISGTIQSLDSKEALPFVNVVVKNAADSTFVSGTITNENGVFTIENMLPGEYRFDFSYIGFARLSKKVFVGSNSAYLDVGTIQLEENLHQLDEVVISAKQDAIGGKLDKKSYTVEDNESQRGGSVIQSMQNLPGVTTEDGELSLRGSKQVMVLIDGKQTAITGFGNQNGLDNIPASAVEKIEIINNPSAKYDVNGNAGIINIVLKKEVKKGFNGKVGITSGLGALWVRKENYPGIRPQYQATPKINPSVSLNFRQRKVNFFLQTDNLYSETLNRNEFVTRTYDDGTVIKQQLKRNRNTNFFTSRMGADWFINDKNSLTVSGFYSQENIKDRGDQPFYNGDLSERLRLWQFLEDETVTAAMASLLYEHKFEQLGRKLTVGFNYTFDREDEKYFFDNDLPNVETQESFFLIADQKVADFSLDYTKPMKHGVLETGVKFRRRTIPTNMQFNPSATFSVLDTGADGNATYKETIPAIYGNYTYEVKKFEAELGLRLEYVDLNYEVDPNHNTYSSNGYTYFQPFPSARLTYNLNEKNKLSGFFNRRVDRPDEVDIRIFPKYDDAGIIKVGNPALTPQFTNTFELGFKNSWDKGYYYMAAYHRISDGTITRIATTVDTSNLIYAVSQNAGRSYNTGVEVLISQDLSDKITVNLNLNGYHNQINAFSVLNKYPVENTFNAARQEIFSGNIKLNTNFKLKNNLSAQLTAIYLAPDIIPQGTIKSRFSLNMGIKKIIQEGKGELFFNASDLLNTMIVRTEVEGNNFSYTSANYYETQFFRLGYSYKF